MQGVIRVEAMAGFWRLKIWSWQKRWTLLDIGKGVLDEIPRLDYYHLRNAPLNYLLRHLWFEDFDLKVRMGTGDPATTALCWGAMWAFLGPIGALLTRRWKGNSAPRFEITPDFNNPTIELDAMCIFAGRTGHYIIAGWLKLLKPVSHNLVRGVANRGSTGRTVSLIL